MILCNKVTHNKVCNKITYCNVYGFLKTWFGLVIGFINNPQVANYNQFLTRYWFTLLKSLHAQSLSLSVVGFPYSASLNHTL
jgi:ATP adenylyltransferase/5',5'''-P-1,P-4-tetraphosphate phosphorylase II